MDRCGSRYRNLDKMPKYIKNRGTLECQEKNIKEVPVWGPCKVSSKNVPSRDEAGQARYGIDIKTEGIDALGYCSYIHDLSRKFSLCHSPSSLFRGNVYWPDNMLTIHL